MRFAALLALVTIAAPVLAQEHPDLSGDWEPDTETNSAGLAMAGFDQTGAAGLSWPDGQQALVTFWRAQDEHYLFVYRCMSFFDADLVPAGEQCARAIMPQ